MKELNLLKEELKGIISWNQARITFLAQFMIALLDAQTTNLTRIAQKFRGKAKIDSHYKRIQRFLRDFQFDFDEIAQIIVQWMPFGRKWILCIDRTNWKFGKANINLMVLGIAYKGVCIPLIWSFLNKRGCSKTSERIELLHRFLNFFGRDRIQFVSADREFIGKEWISELIALQIPFRIRIRNNTKVLSARSHQNLKVSHLFRGCKLGKTMVLKKKRKVWGLSVFVIGLKTKEGYVILITDHKPKQAMEDYKRRWEIETLFGCLKSRGFDFEETHLSKDERIRKLMALLTLTLCWCILYGEILVEQKAVPIKKHGRPAKSVFRRGLEELSNLLANISCKLRAFKRSVQVLSCT